LQGDDAFGDGEIKNNPLFQVIFGFIMNINITKVSIKYEIKPNSKINNEKVGGKSEKVASSFEFLQEIEATPRPV
jgi:hypothetical protein